MEKKSRGELKKTYFLLLLTQTAPLRVGAGEASETDADVVADGRGLPFIPGSSIAGVLREEFHRDLLFAVPEDGAAEPPEDRAERETRELFGGIWEEKTTERGRTVTVNRRLESCLLFSDATLKPDIDDGIDYRILPRDGVKLNDNGTAEDGSKYDFQAVECGKAYAAVIECTEDSPAAGLEQLLATLRRLAKDGVSFGARTTRGYGNMALQVRKREFVFPRDLESWLGFDPLDREAYTTEIHPASEEHSGELRLCLDLEMRGTFSVRQYTASPKKNKEAGIPRYVPMDNLKGNPVIPGSSWAGAFRHHMRDLIRELFPEPDVRLKALDDLFGAVPGKFQRSRIRFSETEVRDCKRYPVTRVAVDRFTNGPLNQGLYTAEVAWHGRGGLEIVLPSDTEQTLLQLLAAAVNDLHLGLLPVGGESNVGRGICSLRRLTVNDIDCSGRMEAQETDYLTEHANHIVSGRAET